MSPKVYFISGLGADQRLFARQISNGISLNILAWKAPLQNESIASYAQRMAAEIPDCPEGIILGGVSFGGMMAIEMSNFIKVKKVIIISSVKTCHELPPSITFWKHFPLHNILNGKMIAQFGKLSRFAFGPMNDEETRTFIDMADDANPELVKWASSQIVNWKNNTYPINTIHIHGTNDHIFPIAHIKEPVIKIKNGSHVMIATCYQEVNEVLKKALL